MWLTALLLTATIVSQEAAHSPHNFNPGPIDLSPTVIKPDFTKRWNNFDFELLHKLGNDVSGNFMISPASVKAVLVMLLEGAGGNCAKELRNTLRLPTDHREIRQELGNYLSRLRTNTPGVIIEAANKVFVSAQYTTNPLYEDILKKYYRSEIQTLRFSQPAIAAQNINNWVAQNTHGEIQNLIDPGSLDAETVIVLVNALYFKGVWQNTFDKKYSDPICFRRNNNDCIMTEMMELQAELKYTTNDEIHAQIVEIPYQGEKYSMMIVLPIDANGLPSLQKDFVQSTMSLILSQLQPTDVELTMPKFTIDYSTDMTSILKKMGIHDLFSQNADLSQMINSTGRPQVNSVVHKTRIQVDEKGTVASAATGAMVVPLMGSSGVRMTVDHPFMFIIREVDSGAILFAGRVEEPGSSSGRVENFGNLYPNRDTVVNSNTRRQPSGSRPVKSPNKSEARPIANNPPSKNYGENSFNINNPPQTPHNQFPLTSTNNIITRPFLPLQPHQNRLSNVYQNHNYPIPNQPEQSPKTYNYRTDRNSHYLQNNNSPNYLSDEAPSSTTNYQDGISFPK